MELLDQRISQGALWLASGALILTLLHGLYGKKKSKEKPKALESILEEEDILSIEQKRPLSQKKLNRPLKPGEKIYWMDETRQDHYEGKQALMILTDSRLIFTHPEFSFAHPIEDMTLIPTKTGFEISIRNNRMKFSSASDPLLFEAWKTLKGTESVKS